MQVNLPCLSVKRNHQRLGIFPLRKTKVTCTRRWVGKRFISHCCFRLLPSSSAESNTSNNHFTWILGQPQVHRRARRNSQSQVQNILKDDQTKTPLDDICVVQFWQDGRSLAGCAIIQRSPKGAVNQTSLCWICICVPSISWVNFESVAKVTRTGSNAGMLCATSCCGLALTANQS